MRDSETDALNFGLHGATRLRGAIRADLEHLRTLLAHLPQHHAGVRIKSLAELRPSLANNGSIGTIAAKFLGDGSRAVRAILFDKTAETNWGLAWHQDRVICVRERRDFPGFGPWTVKDGLPHVTPPFDVLAGMVTVRIHLDDVAAGNAPLIVAPGSHRTRVPVDAIGAMVERCGQYICLAEAGDVWVCATPLLHASGRATAPARRRVLQVDFAAKDLPGGLEWMGV